MKKFGGKADSIPINNMLRIASPILANGGIG